jgi:hypothetical protein
MFRLPLVIISYLKKEGGDEEALTLAVSDLAVVHAVSFADPENSSAVLDPDIFGIFRLIRSRRISYVSECLKNNFTFNAMKTASVAFLPF